MRVREQRENLVSRVPRLQVLFVVIAVIIASFYWKVQVAEGERYWGLAENNRLRRVPLRAPRGLIHDRHGRLLVDNVPSYNLLLDRSRSEDPEKAIDFASEILAREASELRPALERMQRGGEFKPVLIAEDLSLAEVSQFSVAQLEYPEFEIDVQHVRLYRHGLMTAHLLGYLGEATDHDLTREGSAYKAGDLVGKKGVERAKDLSLRGSDGLRELIVDSRGRTRNEHSRRPSAAGQDLRLTIDLELQQEAARYLEEHTGSAVALDPRTGEILALVSSPSYNPNLFSRRLDEDQWRALVDAAGNPLQNRAIQNTHAPGSTFKMIVGLAGLNERAVTPSDSVYCAGSTMIYNRRTRCWLRRGHGWVNLRKAIKESCDIYFYSLGQKLGINRIAQYARLFGLGKATGFDIPGEKSGLIPDTQWSLERRGSPWYPGETVSVAIGQGPILVTPMQLATMTAMLANGGRAVVPHVIAGHQKPLGEPVFIDPTSLEVIRSAMEASVGEERGTGIAVRMDDIRVAGKTGTAQVVEQKTWTRSEDLEYEKRDHAWFVSFAPMENPEIVVVAFVEHGGHGSDAAAPLARRLYETYFGDAVGN